MLRLATIRMKSGELAPAAELGSKAWLISELLQRSVGSLTELMEDWAANISAIRRTVNTSTSQLDISNCIFACPIPAPRKVICIGINYRDHIAEMGVSAPEFPYSFMRPQNCLTGHLAVVPLPDFAKMIDWEAELGVVIGKTGRALTHANALSAVAGYTIVNDVSARDWIESRPFVGIDWVMQKAWDSFQPTGPWLIPADEIADPQHLEIELKLNGVVKQKQNTSQMVFGIAEILVHLSRIMTLEPGDIIATGTPAGVGFSRRPREFIKDGDRVDVSIAGLGTLSNIFKLDKQKN